MIDKPYLIPGELLQDGVAQYQELYWVGFDRNNYTYQYRRSVDGGSTWIGGPILRDDDPNKIVHGKFCAQSIAARGLRDLNSSNDPAGPAFIAYTASNPDQFEDPPTPADCQGARISFLSGKDRDHIAPKDGTVEFTQLLDVDPPDPNDPNVVIHLACGGIKSFIPASNCTGSPWTARFNQTAPQVAFKPADPAEPGDADRLYLVHHDLSWMPADPNEPNGPAELTRDLDVFLWILTRDGGRWDVSAPIRVNRDDPGAGDGDCDQFLANVVVDSAGRIHVVFYDDREYSQDDGQPPTGFPQPRFDYFHAVSPDRGIHWFEHKLVWPGDPYESTIDLNYPCNDPTDPNDPNWLSYMYNLGEYTSVATYPVCWGDDVWTAFSGTWSGDLDPDNDKSVIWYACLRFGPDLNANGIVDVSH